MAQREFYEVGTTILIVGVDRSGTHLLSKFIDVEKKNIEGDPRHHRLVRRLASCDLCPTPDLINRVLTFYEQGAWDLDKTHQMLWLLDYVSDVIDVFPLAVERACIEVIASSLRHQTVPRDAVNAKPCNFWGITSEEEMQKATLEKRIRERWKAHEKRVRELELKVVDFDDMCNHPLEVVDYLRELGIPAKVPSDLDPSRAWS